ncbi:MAG TPA: metal ABC transporter substrate-binding protein [Acidimicrobiia bacterium]|nr:metal ABC transporter substrate-binding protein [Acidimicrobiia bacterium]
MILIFNLKSRMHAVAALLLTVSLVLGACGSSETGNDRLTVVATTSIWGDVVSQILGEMGEVEVLIPRGADPHDYQPTSQQIATVARADLVVANGLGLEEGVEDILESAESDGANILEVAPGLDPLPFAEHVAETEDEEHGALDPHVWFDPNRVARAAVAIATELEGIDDSVDWIERARAYGEELASADRQITEILSVVPDESRKLVTNHDAFGYFADTYGFEIVGVIIPGGSTLGEPSSAELAELVEIIRENNVPAIFAESTQPRALAEAIAAEVGRDVAVVELYTGSLGETPADTLTGMLIEDARRIAEALS